jgi:hypothetical protein
VVASLAFTPDGRTLASGGSDTTILLWDLTGGARDGRLKPAALTAAQLDGLWSDLGGDAGKAEHALWALARAPAQGVPFLRERLRPVAPAEAGRVAGLIAELDSKTFAVRQTAARALQELGEAAEAAVRKALEGERTLEVRRQLERFLESRESDLLRGLRAVEALEQSKTGDAERALQMVAAGATNPRLARAAGAAQRRLAGLPGATGR